MREATGTPLANHPRIVSIFCYGGYDGLNMLVPVTNQAYYDLRPTLGIQPGNTLDLGVPDERLHPAMPRMASLFRAGQCAIVRKVGYPRPTLSHFASQDIHSWGVRDEFDPLGIAPSGWIARHADLYAPSPLGCVALGVGRPLDFEGGTSNPLMAATLDGFDFVTDPLAPHDHEHRLAALAGMLEHHAGSGAEAEARVALQHGVQYGEQILAAVAAYHDADTGSPFRTMYPATSPGVHLRDVATLIRGGFETEIFMTGLTGFDTHGNQGAETGTHATLLARLDEAVGTFADECIAMGVWDDVLVLISSEFGRRNFENGSNGTDHGHGNVCFALGGGVIGGRYGPGLTEDDLVERKWLRHEVDFRDVLRTAIGDHLGRDPAPVFPEPQEIDTPLAFL